MFVQRPDRQGGQVQNIFHITLYMYGSFLPELNEEHNRNRVARPVLGHYTTWSTGTQLSVLVLNIFWSLNHFEYRYSTFSTRYLTSSGLKTALSTRTQLSVPVLNLLWPKNSFEYRYSALSIGTQLSVPILNIL